MSSHPATRQTGGNRSNAAEYNTGTPVPLTLQLLIPIMPSHDLLRWFRRRRKPGEEPNREEVYFFGTGSCYEPLDIGVIRYIVPPGFAASGGAQCHVSSLQFS